MDFAEDYINIVPVVVKNIKKNTDKRNDSANKHIYKSNI